MDSRYCGAPEAAWRLFGFPLQGRSHHVERLPIHLPLEKNVLFTQGAEAQAALAALSRDSKLEAWFRLNSMAPSLPAETCALIRSLRYVDVPRHFTWDAKTTSWKLRAKGLKENGLCLSSGTPPCAHGRTIDTSDCPRRMCSSCSCHLYVLRFSCNCNGCMSKCDYILLFGPPFLLVEQTTTYLHLRRNLETITMVIVLCTTLVLATPHALLE